jgi:hypothetical protein
MRISSYKNDSKFALRGSTVRRAGGADRGRRRRQRREALHRWDFGELPELMEIRKPGGGQTLIGFPALMDGGDAVTIEVFRRARGGRRQAPRRPAPPVCAADQGRAQVPGEEHPRPAEDGRGLHAAGGARRRSCAPRSSTWRWSAPSCWTRCPPTRPPSRRRGRGPRPPDADRQRGGAPGRPPSWPSTPQPRARSRTPKTQPDATADVASSNCSA